MLTAQEIVEHKRIANRKSYKKHKKTRNAHNRTYYHKNKEKILTKLRWYHLKKTYGITPEIYEEMLKLQNGVCAICGGTSNIRPQLFIDHSHKTGSVRSLLCNSCNSLIGFAKEDIAILYKTITYLKKYLS